MKLKKLTMCILAAIATFTLGLSAYTGVMLASSAVPSSDAKQGIFEPSFAKSEPITAAPAQTEPTQTDTTPIEKTTQTEVETQEFYANGDYYLNVEKLPKAFEDFDYLEIETHEYDSNQGEGDAWFRIAPKVSLHMKTNFKFSRIAIGVREIAFQTATVDGVSYKFSGRFLVNDYCEMDGETPDLKGKLIKIKNGKWAAEMDAEFYAMCGC